MVLMDSTILPPPKPINKRVAVGGFVGAIMILVISLATRIGIDISPTESGALTIIVAKGFEYWTKD